jgi:hemolysin activation/secretion protein
MVKAIWSIALLALGMTLGPFPSAAQDEAPTARFQVSGFTVAGENPLGSEETQAILDPYAGTHEGLDGLLSAADALESAIIARGHSFRRVVLPPQTLTGGVVTLEVVTFRVGEITVEGNRHYPDEQVLRALPTLRPGTVPSTRELSRALRVANQHPSRQLGVRFRESEAANAIDATVKVEDSRPWQVVASLANNGTPATERLRLSLAAQHSNVFDLDHVLTVSHTTSPNDIENIKQSGLNYQLPLYDLATRLSAFYVESSVDTGVVDGFEISGSGRFWGVSATHQLLRYGRYNHWLAVGFDNKFFDNDVTQVGSTTALVPDVRSTPIVLTYGGEHPLWGGSVALTVSAARNLKLGSDNDKDTYEASVGREHTSAHWKALRARLDGSFPLPREWALRTVLEGQWADEPLIAGEQFGLGGATSVRGMDERATTGDDGYRATLEVWLPPLENGVHLLGFTDFGKVLRENPEPGTVDNDYVATWGIGLRWQPYPNLNVTLDWGHVLEGTSLTPEEDGVKDGHSQLHANLLMKF